MTTALLSKLTDNVNCVITLLTLIPGTLTLQHLNNLQHLTPHIMARLLTTFVL